MMDFVEKAARRILSVDPQNGRARSVLRSDVPVYFCEPSEQDFQPDWLGPIVRDLAPRIGQLGVMVQDRWQGLGTAWPIAACGGDTLFATAGHVLQSLLPLGTPLKKVGDVAAINPPGLIMMPDGGTPLLKRWICTAPQDLALFLVEGAFAPLPLAEKPSDGGFICALGYPLVSNAGFDRWLSDYQGKLCIGSGTLVRDEQYGPTYPKVDYVAHNASTLPGYSGGPVIDDRGLVVGLHVWGQKSSSREEWNDAVRIDRVRGDWLAPILAGAIDDPLPDMACLQFQGLGAPESLGERAFPLALAPLPVDASAPGLAADRPDSRDRPYRPALTALPDEILPAPSVIGHQLDEGSCAAFAVAGAIQHQLDQHGGPPDAGPASDFAASVRMLDRMARRHDEWLDDAAEGTSLRAVLKGLYHNGVCSRALCPYLPRNADFFMTRELAKDARALTILGYYRLDHSVNDMRQAVHETGSVMVTASIHKGWDKPRRGEIRYDDAAPPRPTGLHAFLVDGYTRDGFVVQSSWGPKWGGFAGLPGHALWSFEDWDANCADAWAIRLAPRSARAFGVSIRSEGELAAPRRIGLLGHMLQSERHGLVEEGTLGLGARGVAETAAFLAGPDGRKGYDRLLLIFHEPLLGQDAVARLALQLTQRLKARRIYPFHVVHGLDEIATVRLRLAHDAAEAAGRYLREGLGRDRALERVLAPVVRSQIEGYRHGARLAARGALRDALAVLPLFAAGQWRDDPVELAGLARRKVQVLSLGLGAIPATELLRRDPFRGLPHLSLAAPVSAAAQHWRLGELREEGDLPGYLGGWGDLVAASLGNPGDPPFRDAALRGPAARFATAQACAGDPGFVGALIRRLDAL